ncbi:MAG: cbb3-type cytochrome oxidase assembly protein CcoS [Pseudomonadota bacterium]
MNVLVILVPCSLLLGLAALLAFVWALRARQYDDVQGDAARILIDEDENGMADGASPSKVAD